MKKILDRYSNDELSTLTKVNRSHTAQLAIEAAAEIRYQIKKNENEETKKKKGPSQNLLSSVFQPRLLHAKPSFALFIFKFNILKNCVSETDLYLIVYFLLKHKKK